MSRHWPRRASERRSTSTATGRGRACGADGCARTSSPARPRRSSSSARRPATAARASPASPSPPSASSRARGPSEATATIVHRVLAELGIEEQVLLWNVVPTHPGTERSNRRPSREEVEAGLPFVDELVGGRRVIAVGRFAEAALGAPYVRHPSHGGATAFRDELRRALA